MRINILLGWRGVDCSVEPCPILCSNRGNYVRGRCECKEGYKGNECEYSINQCEVPNCNGYGKCQGGKCICHPGRTGKHCELGKVLLDKNWELSLSQIFFLFLFR